MRVSDFVIESLIVNGIDTVYGVSGGSVENLQDAMFRAGKRIRFVLSRHETAACFQAVAHYAFSGRMAAVLTTSGAGVFNAYNGVYEAYASRIPMILLAGAIPRGSESITTFQNTSGGAGSPDAVQAFGPCAVFAQKLDRVADLQVAIESAIRSARGPRRGPAVLLLPRDLQAQDVGGEPRRVAQHEIRESGSLDAVVAALSRSRRPVVVVGEGVKRHHAQKALLEFVEETSTAVVAVPTGKDSFPNGHPLYQGVVGIFGSAHANATARNADFLLFVGATEDPFNCFSFPLADKQRASILEGDGDWACSPIAYNGDLAKALPRARTLAGSFRSAYLPGVTPSGPERAPLKADKFSTNGFVRRAGAVVPAAFNVMYECGLVAAAAIHYLELPDGMQHELTLSSASMGYAVAGIIASAIACPQKRHVAFTADGSFLMYGMEIHTAVSEDLDVLFVVVNNGGFGIGVQAQKIFFGGRIHGTTFTPVDCQTVARGLGVKQIDRITTLDEIEPKLSRALELRGVRVLEVMIDDEGCPPMLSFLQAAGDLFGSVTDPKSGS